MKVNLGSFLKKSRRVKTKLIDEDAQDTTERIREALAKANAVTKYTVIALVRSKHTPGKKYEIRLGANNAVYCECKGFQYRSTCEHMKRFREKCKPKTF